MRISSVLFTVFSLVTISGCRGEIPCPAQVCDPVGTDEEETDVSSGDTDDTEIEDTDVVDTDIDTGIDDTDVVDTDTGIPEECRFTVMDGHAGYHEVPGRPNFDSVHEVDGEFSGEAFNAFTFQMTPAALVDGRRCDSVVIDGIRFFIGYSDTAGTGWGEAIANSQFMITVEDPDGVVTELSAITDRHYDGVYSGVTTWDVMAGGSSDMEYMSGITYTFRVYVNPVHSLPATGDTLQVRLHGMMDWYPVSAEGWSTAPHRNAGLLQGEVPLDAPVWTYYE